MRGDATSPSSAHGFGAVAAEAAVIGMLGAVAGVIRAQTGVALDVVHWHPVGVLCPLGMIALGGVVPACNAYRTPVAENLASSS